MDDDRYELERVVEIPQYAADLLADAIEAHLEAKYGGGQSVGHSDAELYGVLAWWQTWKDHCGDPYGPLPG